MRVFIATDINDKIREELRELQQQLKTQSNIQKYDAKWVNPDNIHLTLKFLGEITEQQTLEICKLVEQTARQQQGFELDVETVGFFGRESARVLWVGLGRGKEKLAELQKDLEQKLAETGWPKEKRSFTGHLTLCRIKNKKAGKKLAELTEKYKEHKLGNLQVDSISVYQSTLTPEGAVYSTLANYKLK